MANDGINFDPAKLDKIRQWLKTEKGFRLAFILGLCYYYRDIIPAFANINDAFNKVSRAD